MHIICRELFSNSKGNIVPEIVVGSSNSIPSVKIIAASLLGTLKLSNPQEHFTFNDGSVFITQPKGERFIVTTEPTMELKWPLPSIVPEIYSTNSDEYHEEWASRSYINGLQLLAITVESVYSLQASESVETATESLNWMLTSLEMAENETLLGEDLESILCRLLLIKKSKPNSEQPLLLVPTLTFPVYQDLYNAFLDLLKAYEDKLLEISQEISRRLQTETIVENQDQLNKNILEIGKFLVEMVKADSQYFNDVENMYKNFEQRKIAELELEQEKSKKLFEDVLYYTEEVNNVGEKLAEEVRQVASWTIFQAVVGIAMAIGSMFVGGVGIANIPGNVQGIARVAEKVDYCMVLTEQISIIYNLGQDAAGGINSELAKLPDMSAYSTYFPNALDWSDFDADVEMFTSEGYLTCCKTTGADYKNVAHKLSSRGKAFLDSQSKVSSLQYEITVNKMMASVAAKQKLRLEELASKFSQEELDDYQTNSTDLFEIGDILQSRANDVRMKLAQTYLTMDAALQYYYMKPPTVLNRYDTLDIQATAVQQIVDSILALESFPSKPHNLERPIVYEIPMVRVSALTSPEGYKHRIPLTSSEFYDYIRVRIREIKITINSIESADADGIYIQSNYTGLNFMDRGLDREQKVYHTMSSEYRYVYNYRTGETIVGNGVAPEFEDIYAMMTPFGEWIFRIPEISSNNTNVNIKYSSPLTTIRIEFYLNVIYNPQIPQNYFLRSTCSDSSVNCLLQKIHEHSVTGEWDAVMAMDAQDINNLWKLKYEHNDNGGLAYDVTTDWEVIVDIQDVILVEGRLKGLVGPPLVSFVPNNPDSIKMSMEMKEAVMEERYTYPGGDPVDAPPTIIDEPVFITSFNSITKIQGSVSSQQTVIVNLDSSLIDVTIDGLTGTEEQAMEYALEEYFQTKLNSSNYDLGTVEFDSGVTPRALQPRDQSFCSQLEVLNRQIVDMVHCTSVY